MQIFNLVGNIAIEGVQSAESSMNSLGNSLSNLGNTISQIGNSLVNSISKPLLNLIGTGVKYRATIEDLETQFGVLLNSQSKAAKLMKDIREISRTTPFETESLAEAASTMLTYGIASEKVLPTLMRFGDVAMGNNEHFKMLTYNMSQVSAAGKLQGMDLKSLVLAGWNPLKTIMETTGETMDEVKQRMADGLISYDEVEKALIKVTSAGGRFHDGMAKGSLTLNGRISTLKDTFMEFAAEISKPIFEKIKEIVPQVTDVLDGLAKKFNLLDKDSKNVVLGIGLFAAAFPLLIIAVGGVVIALGAFMLILAPILTTVGLVTTAIGILVGGTALGGLIALLTNLPSINFSKWKNEFETLKNKAIEIYGYFSDTWKPAIKYLLTDDPVELAKIEDSDFRDSIENLKNVIEKFTENAKKTIGDVGKAFKKIDKKDVVEFSENIADLASILIELADAITTVIDHLGTFWDLMTFQKGIDDVFNIDLDPLGLDKIFGEPLTVKQLINLDADVDDTPAKNKIKKSEDDMKLVLSKNVKGNKPLSIDAIVNDMMAKSKIDISDKQIKTKANSPIENVIKSWGTDAIINDSPAKSKTDSSNTQIKTKSKEVIPNVMKAWGTDATINDTPAKTKTDSSNKNIKTKSTEIIPNVMKSWSTDASVNDSPAKNKADKSNRDIKSKANESIPNITKAFSIFADIDISGALNSISNAFTKIRNKISSVSIGNIKIPGFAQGVRNYQGGLAVVGEKGAELVDLPKGSNVYTANETKKMLSTPTALSQGNSTNIFNVTVDARNIKDFNDVINVFSRIKTEKITRLGVI